MAGWDGDGLAGNMEDALERQQEAAEARRHAARKDTSSPEERERQGREESARLSRAHLVEQLERASHPAHRAMLERALKALNAEATISDAAHRDRQI